MHSDSELLEFAKSAVATVAAQLDSYDADHLCQVNGVELEGRETKLVADAMLDDALCHRFRQTGLSILTEESGLTKQSLDTDLCWVIDPLDGSVNYLRGTGPSAISVALCSAGRPVFGVLYDLTTRTLSWGGQDIGAWSGDQPIRVSSANRISESMICTGIPARFRANDANVEAGYFGLITRFAKVRMLGSAACSLLLVAQGKADAYLEDGIMFWDVAAGLAIVEGAGGMYVTRERGLQAAMRVFATNGRLAGEGDLYEMQD